MRYEEYDSLIMSASDDICYIADRNTYELFHVTKKGMEIFGLKSPEEYLGKKCYEVLQGRDEPCPYCTNSVLSRGHKYQWEHYNEQIKRWIAAEDTLVNVDGKECRLEWARDIHDQKAMTRRLSDTMSVEDILVDCVQAMAVENNHENAFNRFLERMGRYYRAARAYIFEIDINGDTISNTYEWCSPSAVSQKNKIQKTPISTMDGLMQKFKQDGEIFICVSDGERNLEPKAYKVLEDRGAQSLIAAPLLVNGEIAGFIGIDDPENCENDMRLLKATANFVMEELRKYHLVQRLEYMNYTDDLTGVQNRNKYVDMLNQYEGNPPQSLGVVYVDINGMKSINDSYGQKYGDKLLENVSDMLKKYNDFRSIYRVGGDEFVMLYENITRDNFYGTFLKMKQAFAAENYLDVALGCSWAEGEVDVSSQVVQADKMMYAEKQSYYQKALSEDKPARVGMAKEVMQEIEHRRFVVYYQPQIDIRSNKVIGAEALVRKLGKNGEIVAPDKFIPYYEREGVIRYVDFFVFEEVCETMKKWQKEGIDLKVSVNLSRSTLLETQIVEHLIKICRNYGVSPESITLEVTESISTISHEELCRLFTSFAMWGFTISLDDFGSKYSNLSILSDMDFSEVKLDKTLVDQLVKSSKSQSIMRNIIQMCQDIKVSHVLAEGIETKEQLNLLAEYNCGYGQGYYFSRPLPLKEFNEFLKKHNG